MPCSATHVRPRFSASQSARGNVSRGRKAGGLPFGPGNGPQGKETLPYWELAPVSCRRTTSESVCSRTMAMDLPSGDQ